MTSPILQNDDSDASVRDDGENDKERNDNSQERQDAKAAIDTTSESNIMEPEKSQQQPE